MLGAACKRKLIALQHPKHDSVDLADLKSFRTLVVWLENRKIRSYPPEERGDLDKVDSPGWSAAFDKYLKDLGCLESSSTDSKEARHQICDWLLTYAIGMEYSDRASELQKIESAPKAKGAPAKAQVASMPSVPQEEKIEIEMDVETEEFRSALEQLAAALGLPADDSSEAMVRACCNAIEQKLSAHAIAKRTESQSKSTGGKAPKNFKLEDFPPGFDTGDTQLNKAAALLRLLYVSDLRKLQNEVNQLIAVMQEYTASPKTDASLGKVGR